MADKLSKKQENALKKRADAAKNDLVAFRYFLLNNGKDEVEAPEFHFNWSDILLKEKDNFAIEGFRQSGKGQIVLRSYPLYCLRFPSTDRDYIVLIKQNGDLATQKLIEIEAEYRTNPALNSNLVKIHQESAKIFSVDVRDVNGKVINVRIEAYGKGSSIRGLANVDRRPRIAIIDDPQDTEDAKSETVLENDWEWFLSDVMFLGKTTRIFLIGNNLGDKCIAERVFANAKNLGFQTRKIAILGLDGQPAWHEMFTLEKIEQEKEAYRSIGKIDIWMRERMCEATSQESRVFDLKDIIRYSYLYVEKMIKDANLFITVDPASSKERSACYRAIIVNAVTPDNRWIIVDCLYGRWLSDVFIDKLFEAVLKWTPTLGGTRRIPVGIEKGHFKQILEPFIHKEMQRRNVFFDIVPIEHASVGSKLERVKMLGPRFKAKTIMLPEQATWLAELECELNGVTIDGFKSLYTDLCFVKGTKISTLCGDKNIENITRKDLIITPFGIRKVKACGFTGNRKTIKKFGLEATPNHKIFCYEKGFASIDALCYIEHISQYNIKEAIQWAMKKVLYGMEKNTTLMGRASIISIANARMEDISITGFIGIFLNFIRGSKYQKAFTFIIKTAMSLIMTLTIYACYRSSNIIHIIRSKMLFLKDNTLRISGLSQLLGISLKRARVGISNTLLMSLRTGRRGLENAIFAVKNINIFTPHQNIVLQGACSVQSQTAEGYTKKENVLCAEKNLNAGNTFLQKHAHVLAQQNMAGGIQLSEKDVKPVYNLTVEQDGVYYANGVLVSNCDALAMQQQIARAPSRARLDRDNYRLEEVTGYSPLDGTYSKQQEVFAR